MSKYRRISSNVEIKEKKKQKNSNQNGVDTKTLMEKLGIKVINGDKSNKKYSLYIKHNKLKEDNYQAAITCSNENKNNSKSFKSQSLQKRNRNDNINIKNKNISTSFEKRIIMKDKNKKNTENKYSDINKNKEKDKNAKSKKNIKESNDKNENSENISRKKTIKIKKEIKYPSTSLNTHKEVKKIQIKKNVKILQFRKDKESDNIRRSSTTKINKNTTTNDINKSFSKKLTCQIEDNKIKEEDISPKKIRTKKIVDKKSKFKNESKEKDKEIEKKSEKQNKFRKNKAVSVDKIIADKIFDFNSNKLSNKSNKDIKRKSKNKNNKSDDSKKSISRNSSKNNAILSGSKSVASDSEYDSENSSISENDKNNTVLNKVGIIRSNKRHLTEMASQKQEKNEENKKIEKNEEKANIEQILKKNEEKANIEKNEKIDDEKAVKRSNKRHLTELSSQKYKIKEYKDIARTGKKRLTEIPIANEGIDKKIDGESLGRRSVENPLVREKLELLMNNIVLKQNGGNSLFLKNYEKGRAYKKEIELLIKNQKVKKTIKINSCTKAGCSGPGIVKTNQDSYFIKENFLKNNNNIFLGVCDGHGERGEMISRYVSIKLPEYIKDLNTDNIANIFKKINEEVYNNKSMESNMSGTTVVSLFLTTEKMISSNIGDSRAALFKYENGLYYCKNLTRDHKPSEPDENKRIISNNGRIKKCYDEDLKKYLGPDRVWLKNKEEPGLAMSRSIGDKIAHTVGVSDEPEFKIFEYDGTEKFIIIASDGIWEYMNGDDCIKIVKPYYEEGKDSEEAALALVKEAFRKWKRKEVAIDDITVIVIFFDD